MALPYIANIDITPRVPSERHTVYTVRKLLLPAAMAGHPQLPFG